MARMCCAKFVMSIGPCTERDLQVHSLDNGIYSIINITRLSVMSVTVAAALASWPVTMGVVEVGGVSQPGADAERYRCARVLAGWAW